MVFSFFLDYITELYKSKIPVVKVSVVLKVSVVPISVAAVLLAWVVTAMTAKK